MKLRWIVFYVGLVFVFISSGCTKPSIPAEIPKTETEKVAQTGVKAPESMPAGCTQWFDGCNQCKVLEGRLLECTEMACFVMEDPKCLAYKN